MNNLLKKICSFSVAMCMLLSMLVPLNLTALAFDAEKQIKGDVNGDNTLDVIDVVMGRSVIIGDSEFSAVQKIVGDMNNDENFDILDIVLMRATIIGMREIEYITIDEPDTDVQSEIDSDTEIDTGIESETDTVIDSETEIDVQSDSDLISDTDTESETESESESETDAESDSDTENQTDTETEEEPFEYTNRLELENGYIESTTVNFTVETEYKTLTDYSGDGFVLMGRACELNYKIPIPKSGTYKFTLRETASSEPKNLSVRLTSGSYTLYNESFTSNMGLVWFDKEFTADLYKGTYTLTITCPVDTSYNVCADYVDIEYIKSIPEQGGSGKDVELTKSVDGLDTSVTTSTRFNFSEYANTVDHVDINGDKLYSQDTLEKNFGRYGNLYSKSLYDNGKGSDIGIVFCGWNLYNYIEDPDLQYKLNFFVQGGDYGCKRMAFIPTYYLDTYGEGIRVNDKNTLAPADQADIMADAVNLGAAINYRLHIDPYRFGPEGINKYGTTIDTSIPGSQWWRGEFNAVHPMSKDYLAMVDQGIETLTILFNKIDASKLSEPIRFDIGAELMMSVKLYTSEWCQLVDYVREKINANPKLKNNVLISYNFCHHIEYLIELNDNDEYFSRIVGSGVTYEARSDLLYVDDMTDENRAYLKQFITSLDSFSISQYMPLDIFNEVNVQSSTVPTTPQDVCDALVQHEQNFLQKVLIGKLGIAPDEIPPFHIGEYGMGIKGLSAPNVWDRTKWSDNELVSFATQQKHVQIAVEGLKLYMQDERSVAKSLVMWISGAPYDFLNFYPGMNVGDSGHGYPGEAAYNPTAANAMISYWKTGK